MMDSGAPPQDAARQDGDRCSRWVRARDLRRVLSQQVHVIVLAAALRGHRTEVIAHLSEYVPAAWAVISVSQRPAW